MRKDKYKPQINSKDEKAYCKAMQAGMSKGEHKMFFESNLQEFEQYKKFMDENLVEADTSAMDTIYKVKITYQLKKNVWREYEVYGYETLSELAEDLIDSMGWMNDHLHSWWFKGKEGKEMRHWYNMYEIGCEYSEDESYPAIHDDKVCIANINFDINKKLGFAFDFGDDHRFLLELISKRKEEKSDHMRAFPLLVDQRGVGPEQYPPLEEC